MTRETDAETTDDHTDRDCQRTDRPDAYRASPTDAKTRSVASDGADASTGHEDAPASAGTDVGMQDGSTLASGRLPNPPTRDGSTADLSVDPEGVLTPADLERAARRLRELDDERVLVPTDGSPPETDEGSLPSGPGQRGDRVPEREPRPREGDGDAAASTDAPAGLAEASLEAETAYAVDVVVRTDHGPAAESFRSNDVRVVFEELLRWYTGRIEPGRDPEAVLEVLLAASDLDATGR